MALDSSTGTTKKKTSLLGRIYEFITGCLIGLAELVPGISGGTVALVMGIYGRALANAEALIHLARVSVSNRSKLKEASAKVEWVFLAVVGVGMIGTVLTMAGVMNSFVTNHAEVARGLFLGMVAVSIYVPYSMISKEGKKKHGNKALAGFIIGAIATFFGTGITAAEKTDPSMLLIFVAAAIAVCALIMPGLSGSYLLFAMGLYAYITNAVDNRDLPVMGVFVLGALTGLVCFVKVINYLLNNHNTVTLATMSGVMLGSLRSLWPWQNDNADLLAPSGNVGTVFFMIILGAVIVAAILTMERAYQKRKQRAVVRLASEES